MKADPIDPGAASRAYPRMTGLVLLMVSYVVYNIDKNILSVLIEPIKLEFGMSDGAVGMLSGLAMIIPFVIACIPMGMLADRMSRKVLLTVLLAGWSLSVGLGSLASGVLLLFIARMGVGFFESGFNPTSLSLLNDIFPRDRRSTAMGFYALGAPIGMFIVMALGGYVAHAYGWRTVFFIAMIPGICVAAIIGLALPDPPRVRSKGGTMNPGELPQIVREIWASKPLFHTGVGMAYCTVVLANLAIWSPSFLVRIFDLGLHQAGLYAAVMVGAFGACGALGAGWFADRLARRGEWRRVSVVLFGIALCITCGLIAFLFVHSLALALLFMGLTAFFGQFYIGIGNSIIATHSPDRDRAGALAVLTIGFNVLSYGLGPTLVGLISDAVAPIAGIRSIGWGLSATLLFSAIGAIHFAFARRALRSLGTTAPGEIDVQSVR